MPNFGCRKILLIINDLSVFLEKSVEVRKNSDPSDVYYTKIANTVLTILDIVEFDKMLENNMTRRVALALTSWFEDIISDLGIWRAFTAECKRRYGSYLPFYDTSEENYFPDEINLVDVQFLLWHYVQQNKTERTLVNPKNIGLRMAAESIFYLFDREYEEAPVNQTFYNLFANLDVSRKSFYPLRNVMEWFCYDCYLNIYNEEKLFDRIMDFFEDRDIDERDTKFADMMTYNIRVNHLLSARNTLALTSYQWLAMIVKDATKRDLLSNIIHKQHVGIYVDSADKEYVYAREIGSNSQTIKITVESFNLKNINQYLGKTALTSLLYFDGVWWVSGTIMQIDVDKLEDSLVNDQKNDQIMRDTYDLFVKNTKGKRVLFFKNTDEYEIFVRKTLGFQGDKANFFPAEVEGHDLFICANPKCGIYTLFNRCSCFKHPDNPMYNKEDAKKYAVVELLDTDVPYYITTLMIDEGLFADAQMINRKGEEHGHKLIQDNIYFLNDYFRECCRDIDYIE